MNRAVVIGVIGYSIFMLSGGLDFVYVLLHGSRSVFQNPKVTATAPVMMMLTLFGFLGLMFVYYGGKGTGKLANRRKDVGYVMVLFIFVLMEILLRVALS